MTTHMPVLETARLRIRPFELGDLAEVYRLLDVELREAELGSERMDTLAGRETWLRWVVLNYEQLALLYQPPYGDRAMVLKDSGELVGACGYVPCLMPFEQMEYFAVFQPPHGSAQRERRSPASDSSTGSSTDSTMVLPADSPAGAARSAGDEAPTFYRSSADSPAGSSTNAPAELQGRVLPATPEFGLFYAVFPAHQHQGYASEAARALLDYAFGVLRLKRVVATTTYDNAASMGVMRRLGMRIERNPLPEPHHLQVVGVAENRI